MGGPQRATAGRPAMGTKLATLHWRRQIGRVHHGQVGNLNLLTEHANTMRWLSSRYIYLNDSHERGYARSFKVPVVGYTNAVLG